MMENFVNAQVFKKTDEEKKLDRQRRLHELRTFQMQLSGISIRTLLEFGIEWQEATGKLLKAYDKPGWQEKLKDAENRRKELDEFYTNGKLKA